MSKMQSIMKISGGGGVDLKYIRFFLSLVASSTFSIIMLAILMGGLLACGESSSSTSRKGSIEGLAALRQMQAQVLPNDGTIRLRWEAPSEASHVVIKAVSDTETVQVSIPSIAYKTLFQQNKYYHLKGLKEFTTYTVYIEARLGNRVSSQVVQKLTTGRDNTAPEDTLEQVSVAKTGSGIKVVWDTESVKAGTSDISEATIYIKDKATDEIIKEVAVEDITKGAVNVDTLPTEAGKVYDIEVIYTDRNSKTSTTKKLLSDIVPSKLSEEIEGIDKKNFSVEAKNKEGEEADESLLIKWGEGFVYTDGKQVSVQVKETATKVLFLDTKINNESSDTLSSAEEQNNDYVSWYAAKDGLAVTKLYGTQEYSISIRVYENGRYSPAVEKTIVTTDKTTEPVEKLSAAVKETGIVVKWQAPAVRDYAGVEITVTEKVTEKNSEPATKKEKITDSNIKEKEITGLITGKTYNISVQSVDKAGNKGKAVKKDIQLAKDTTRPEAVSGITASYSAVLSNNKVATTIRWTAPDSSKAKNQDIKVYKLSITKDADSKVLSDEEIAYPLTEYYTEILEQSTMYTVSILSEDYAGNPSVKVAETITTPSPPEVSKADRPEIVLDTNGEIQVKVSFSKVPGAGVYYRIRMYEEENFIKEKSITGSVTTLSFGIADGLKVPREQVNAKKYGFKLIKFEKVISPPIDLTPKEDDKVEVYDDISTAPPVPKTAKMLFAGDVNAEQAGARYEFTVGDFTEQEEGSAKYKAPDGSQLEKDEVIYKVYIVEGAESKAEDIKSKATQVLIVTGARNTDTHSVAFAGKKEATYTAVVEAINTLNPSSYTHVLGGSETIKTITLSTPTTLPKTSTFADSDAVVYTVPESGANTGKNVLRVRVKKTDISGIQKTTKEPLIDSDLAYYVIYAKAEDFTSKPTDVESLWTGQKEAKRIAKYEKVAGRNTAIIDIDIVDSRSEEDVGSTPVEEAKDYYVGVRIVNTTAREYNADDKSKLFIKGYFIDLAEIKEIRTSNAVAPAQVSNIQVTSKATIATIKWNAPTLDESHKTRTGEQLTTAEVSYKVYMVEKNEDSERRVDQIKAADNSPQTVRAGRTRLELIGLTKNTSYELVVQAINSTDETKASIGIREEFRTNESFVIRDIKRWKKHKKPLWSERESKTVNFKNRIWIIGGSNKRNYFNEVWSSADGKRWKKHITYVKGDSTKKKPIWSARYRMATIVFKNKIWIMGGVGNNYYNDVWSSADGEVWEKHTTRNEDTSKTDIWSRRAINAFVKFNDRIWIFGGNNFVEEYNDVWSSADGETWKKHSTHISDMKITTFFNIPDSAIVFNDEIWLIDSDTGIWSSGDGEVWTPFGNKDILLNRATLLQWDSKLWILGGYWFGSEKDISKKVWSSGDGKTWYEHVRNVDEKNTIWENSTQGTFTVFKNKLWLLGGWIPKNGEYNNDVWSFPHTIQE